MKKILQLNLRLLLLLVLSTVTSVAVAQNVVTGTVLSADDNQPLPGVNILIKNSTTGTSTNVNGKYSLEVSDSDVILVFSFVGYIPEEIQVGNRSIIDLSLTPDISQLQEIVVIGYGTQKKSDITGSVASFDTKTLENRPQTNLVQALQGNVAGITVTTNTSSAEEGGAVLIRGQNSINANNDPLIVLDGIIYDGSLTDINPNDIQNMEILKDASSTAIYGSRGANGVILITTKRGTVGKVTVSYNTYYSFDEIANLPDMQDASEYWANQWERSVTNSLGVNNNPLSVVIANAFVGTENTNTEIEAFMQGYPGQTWAEVRDGILAQYPDFVSDRETLLQVAEDFSYPEGGRDADWVDLATRTGHRQEHNLSIAGGTEKINYFVSATHTDVEGIAVNDKFERTVLRFNLNFNLNEYITYGTNTQVAFFDRSGIPANWEGGSGAFQISPLYNAFNLGGALDLTPDDANVNVRNPLERTLFINEDEESRIITNQYINIKIPYVEGLEYKLNYGYQQSERTNRTYEGRNTINGANVGGRLSILEETEKSWLLENILSYRREFGKHSLFLTGLYSFQDRTRDVPVNLTAFGFPNDVRTFYQLADADVIIPAPAEPGEFFAPRLNVSQMFRVNYVYDDRYLITSTVRRDGYSAFGDNNQYGVFPSVALGWNVTNESFFNVNQVDELKLRLSYGENGNDGVPFASTRALLEPNPYIDENEDALPGFNPETLSNESLQWETTKSFNVGIDFSLFKGRVTGAIDAYTSNTDDLLLRESINPVNGARTILTNIGETQNRGFEIQLNSYVIDKNNLSWKVSFVGSRYRQEIVDVNQRGPNGEIVDDIASELFIGHPVNVLFDYELDRILQREDFILDVAGEYVLDDNGNFQLRPEVAEQIALVTPTARPGQPIIRDVNGDGEIGADDRVIIGDENPSFTAGLTNVVTYKNWTFSMLLNGVWGVTRRNTFINNRGLGPRRKLNIDFWTPENPTSDLPGINSGGLTGGFDLFPYFDANYVRIQDVSLAYRIPTEKLPIESLELYANVRNLYTFTDWEGVDPDFNTNDSTDDRPSNDLPRARSYIFGLRLKF